MSRFILIFLIVIFISCDSDIKTKKKYNLNKLQIEMTSFFDSLHIKIRYKFFNQDSTNYYMPLTYWTMMGMDYSGFYMIAEPKDPYIINTIHYLPENSKLIGIGEMTGMTKFANMPYFLKISKGRKYTIELIFNRYYENNGNTFNRFSDSYQYKLISKISVLPQIKFYTLLKSLNIFDYKKSFIYKKDYNCLISSKKTIVANETFKESNISLNKNDFIIINKMFRAKITLHSNIKKMDSSLSF